MSQLNLLSQALKMLQSPESYTSTAHVQLQSDIEAFLVKRMAPFNAQQLAALEVYDDRNHLVQSPEDVADCGDGLLTYLLVELSSAEDCDSMEEAVSRLDTSIRQLEAVREHLEYK